MRILNHKNFISVSKPKKMSDFKGYNKYLISVRDVLEVPPNVITRKVEDNFNETCVAIIVYSKLYAKQSIATYQKISIPHVSEKVLNEKIKSFQHHKEYIQKGSFSLNERSFYPWFASLWSESKISNH